MNPRSILNYENTLAYLVPLLFLISIQAFDWIVRNGVVFSGTCITQFGEPYPSIIPEWLLRLLSPFALPGVLFILLVGGLLTKKAVRHLRGDAYSKLSD